MQRNYVTILSHLKKGDRFYKGSSKDKQAFELIREEGRGKYAVCCTTKMKNGLPLNVNQVKIFKGSTVVIFLRNVNDKS